MRYSWGFFGINKKVYATVKEQKIIAELTGLPMRAVYSGDEYMVVLEMAKQEMLAGRASYRAGSNKLR